MLNVAWSKNSIGIDHGSLFQKSDRTKIPHELQDGGYEPDPEIGDRLADRGFMRTLKETVGRLELLGFNMDRVASDYGDAVEYELELHSEEADIEDPRSFLSFEQYMGFIKEIPLDSLEHEYDSNYKGDSIKLTQWISNFGKLGHLPGYCSYDKNYFSELSHFGSLIDILHPYSLLRALAENKENLKLPVCWHYGALCESGWENEDIFCAGPRRSERFLVATEGTSDIHILKLAISTLRPDIADFLVFFDISKGHPFSGAGSLRKFVEGLVKIDVQNQTLILLDNDAEGVDAKKRIMEMSLPENMRVLTLPDHEDFDSLPIEGPDGTSISNLNGRAIAIECYLDFQVGTTPKFTWTNRKPNSGIYQGAMENKEVFSKIFLGKKPQEILGTGYDTTKLELVIQSIIGECVSIATGARDFDPRPFEIRDRILR